MTALLPRPTPTPFAQIPTELPRPDPITRLPIVVLEVHNRCNCRCAMCDIWRPKPREELDHAQVRGWLDDWRRLGVQRVVLTGGEPLMHSRLWDICEVLAGAGLGITLLTTGLLLGRDAPKVARYCDDVVVSLDGPRDVHDAIRRVPRAFDRLAGGVAALRAASASVAVSGRCTVQQANYTQLRATVAAAREIGLGRISFLPVDVSSEAFDRPGGWPANRVTSVALAEADLHEFSRELDALERDCADDFASGFIAEGPAKLRRMERYFAALLGHNEPPPNRCNAPWVSAVIGLDGAVKPCFFHAAVGNMAGAGSLSAVVNGPQARAFRRNLDVRQDPICRRCVCTLALDPGSAPR